MLGPESLGCFPFGSGSNCCLGGMEGSRCASDSDCRGLSSCQAGSCSGASGCERACTVPFQNTSLDCCQPEAFFSGSCEQDEECQGLRKCIKGFCAGDSGCTRRTSGQTIVYDKQCICANTGNLCSFAHGVPCADGCTLWMPSEDNYVCSRIDALE